ncbi:MAG TPA: 50S ribosomal protein L18 [Candidatus Omnitrophica bacterium]|nr:50S ribosomal protein L18 [Candidatus Omnitrophota bacterium]
MKTRTTIRTIRHSRIRKRIYGTSQRPRLSVFRSPKNIYAQIIDDVLQRTLVFVSTLDKNVKKTCGYGGNQKSAQILGEALAVKAKEKGISKVVFDRGGYLYHGRVKSLAEGARKAGLEF